MSDLKRASQSSSEELFPRELKGFRFTGFLSDDGKPARTYRYGLYQDANGRRAVAKLWVGRASHSGAYWLKREALAYQAIWQALSISTSAASTRGVRVPEFYGYYADARRRLLLIEYIDGRRLAECDAETQFTGYVAAVDFLDQIGREIAVLPIAKRLPRRGLWYWALLSPCITLGALLRHPREWQVVLRAGLAMFFRLPVCFGRQTLAFGHHDLSAWNIMVRDGTYYLIDFGLASLSHTLTDIVNVSLKLTLEGDLGERLIRALPLRPLLRGKQAFETYRMLALGLGLYNLCLTNGRPAEEVWQFLRRWTQGFVLPKHLAPAGIWHTLKKRLASLRESTVETVEVFPFDPRSREIADILIGELAALVPDHPIHLLGSVGMGIAGRKDIDIFIECPPAEFAACANRLAERFGAPFMERADFIEWKLVRGGYEADILVIDPTSLKFQLQAYVVWTIQHDPVLLKRYEELKLSFQGAPIRAYEAAKKDFFDEVDQTAIFYFDPHLT